MADGRVTSGRIWQELCDTLRDASHLVLGEGAPDDAVDRAEGFLYLTRLLANGINVCVELADPDHPEFGRMIEFPSRWGLDSPDCLYLYASVRDGARYRLFGRPGGANHLDIQVNFGHFASGDIASWGTVASLSGPQLERGPDGTIEVAIGGEPRDRNWLPLAPDAEFLLVRQYFADWENEPPADLYVERTDATGAVPRLHPDELLRRLDRLRDWMTRGGALWDAMSRGMLGLPPNHVIFHQADASAERAGLRGQAYGMGNFTCAPDEAVVVEFTPPPCRHWSVSLADRWWESIDYASRQSSLNGHQARLDGDGVFRGVIAHADPGVANWLDTAGHERGTLAIRFLLPETETHPRLRAVKLVDLSSSLPADTPRVSPAQRAATLSARRRAVWRRFRR
jgi:hypothetical protein